MTCSTHSGQNNSFEIKQNKSSLMEFPVLIDMQANPPARDELYCIQFNGSHGDAAG